MRVSFMLLGAVFSGFLLAEPPAEKMPAAFAGAIDFTKDIRPIFDRSCLKCHGAEKRWQESDQTAL